LIKDCDTIFYLERGQIKSRGSFDQLIDENENFSRMVNLQKI